MIISKFSIPLYGIIIIISLIIGITYILLSLNKHQLLNKSVLLYFLMYFYFAIFFGKLFTILAGGDDKNFLTVGLSSYGGLFGVLTSAIIFEKIYPFKGLLLKYVTLSLPLVYGISKLACFFSGCCFGIPYEGVLSVTYPDGLNIPLFPVQLLETVVSLIIFFICQYFKEKKLILYITIILIAVCKFSFEFFRYDHLGKILNFNQIFSMILFVGIILLWFIRKKVRK